jgi:hypothetical protein
MNQAVTTTFLLVLEDKDRLFLTILNEVFPGRKIEIHMGVVTKITIIYKH